LEYHGGQLQCNDRADKLGGRPMYEFGGLEDQQAAGERTVDSETRQQRR
jgi:hypothetical protein